MKKRRIVLALVCALLVSLVPQVPAVASSPPVHAAILGVDRYSTAEIATQVYAFPGGTTATSAVVVSGFEYYASPAGMALAKTVGGPVVPTSIRSLPTASTSTLQRLGVKNVYVLGTSDEVSSTVIDQLSALVGAGGTVTRVEGADPIDLSAAAAIKTAEEATTPPTEVFLVPWAPVPAYTHQLSYAVAPFAYAQGIPILFTDPSAITTSTSDALESIGVKHAVIVGSSLYASPSLEGLLKARGISSERITERGRDGFAPAAAEWAIARGIADPANLTVVGSSTNFPDMLVGGMIAGCRNGVTILTTNQRSSFSAQDFFARHSSNVVPLGYQVSVPGALPAGSAGSIAGTVTAEGSSTALAGIRVTAWGWDPTSTVAPYYCAGEATTAADGTYVIDRLEPTRYWLTFEDASGAYFDESYDNAPPEPTHGDLVPVSANETSTASVSLMDAIQWSEQRVTRISGDDRYETAIDIADSTFVSSERAVLVTGQNFADALSASALAGAYGAPLMLTRTASIPDGLEAELTKLGVKKLLVVGGDAAVSKAVRDQLAADGFQIEAHIYGADRWATSAKVYDYMKVHCPNVTTEPFVVRGDTFPDALSAAPFSYRQARPILLVQPKSVPKSVKDLFATYEIGSVILVGSETAVSDEVLNQLAGANGQGSIWYLRLKGADRYGTALAVAKAWGRRFDYVGVATGLDFPDALSGGAAAGARGGAVVLTKPAALNDDSRAFFVDNAATLWQVRLFGGSNVVNDAVLSDVWERTGTAALSAQGIGVVHHAEPVLPFTRLQAK